MLYIYTDGSCSGNGKDGAIGGYGFVILNEKEEILMDGSMPLLYEPTNNKAELMAIHAGITIAMANYENEEITLYSDSAYCVNLLNTWMYSWEKNNWIVPSTKKEPANFLVVKALHEILNFNNSISIQKVKGHSTDKWNNYVDSLAVKGTETAKKLIKEKLV